MWGCEAPKELVVMQRKWIVIAAAVIAVWPAGLDAQRTPRPPRAPRAPRAFAYSYSTENRGRIGVIVNTEPDSQTDKIGAKLEAVTPGGPAAKAGLKVGDVITKFNGTSLAGAKAEDGILVVKAPSDWGLPVRSGDVILTVGGRKPSSPSHAMRIFHSYEPGETVSIELMRKQKRMTVTWKVPAHEEHMFPRHHEREDQSSDRRTLRHTLRLQRV